MSSESPHRGNFNEYTQFTIFNIKKNILNYPISAAMGFFIEHTQGTQKRVRNSCGNQATSVQATEGLLYIQRHQYIHSGDGF